MRKRQPEQDLVHRPIAEYLGHVYGAARRNHLGQYVAANVSARFLVHVHKKHDEECWLWKAWRDKDGYGRFWLEDKNIQAHRASHIIFIGPIPAGLCVLHECDNPSCVNPRHLFVGTHADNSADMVKKGRSPIGRTGNPGSAAGTAKLTDDQAVEIFLASGKQRSIAKSFGIDHSTVCNIKTRKTWSHLTVGLVRGR